MLLGIYYLLRPGSGYATEPASEPCGLSRGNCYRVIEAFSAGEVSFACGEILVFMTESHYPATSAEDTDYGEDPDFYKFEVLDSDRQKQICSSSTRGEDDRMSIPPAPNVKDWVSCLEHVREPDNELVELRRLTGHTRVVGRVVSPDGTPLRRAKVTLSHNGTILVGGRSRADGGFDVGASHAPSYGHVTFRVVRRGYAPYVDDVAANHTHRAPRLVLSGEAT